MKVLIMEATYIYHKTRI